MGIGKNMSRSPKTIFAISLILSLFFMWGVANNLNDVLIQQFKKAFDLTDLQAGLVQSAFYTGYFLAAMPAAMFMRRFSYKAAIIFGLILYGLGALLFYPAAQSLQYEFFLMALFVIAIGLTFLETSANPFVVGLGSPETAARRLNFAQAFNPLGSITGVLIGRQFIFEAENTEQTLMQMSEAAQQAHRIEAAHAVQLPYIVIGVFALFWAVIFLLTQFPAVADETIEADNTTDRGAGFGIIFKRSKLAMAVLAQFFYVGAQVGVWSYLIRYVLVVMPEATERQAADYLMLSLVLFFVGRFVGTFLIKYIPALKLMLIYGVINAVLMLIAIMQPSYVGVLCLTASSFFMSIMYPTIFATGIEGLGKATKTGASLLVMAIIGGAVLTALMGYVSDQSAINMAFAVPFLAFLFIAVFAYWAGSQKREPVATDNIAIH